ncbi:MAG: hypothetical protein WAK16_08800 [Candidatus Cybelea sp.]
MSTFLNVYTVAISVCILLVSATFVASIREAPDRGADPIARSKHRRYVVFIGLIVLFVLLTFAALAVARQLIWYSPLVVVAFAAAGAGSGFLLHFPFDWLALKFKTRSHDEIAGHFIGLVGVLYAIVLGFVVVTAWEQYYRAEEVSTNEQSDVYDLFNTVAFYDFVEGRRTNLAEQTQVDKILSSLTSYADGMQGEGQLMRSGWLIYPDKSHSRYRQLARDCSVRPTPAPTPGAVPTPTPGATPDVAESAEGNDNAMAALRCQIVQLRVGGLRDQAIYQSSLRLLTDLSDLRNNRRHHYSRPPLQPEMWTAFVLGGLILVGMLYLVEASSSGQKVRAMAVGSMIGMMWALALIFNYPFSGSSPINVSGNSTVNDEPLYGPWCYFESAFVHEGNFLSPDEHATISDVCAPLLPSPKP